MSTRNPLKNSRLLVRRIFIEWVNPVVSEWTRACCRWFRLSYLWYSLLREYGRGHKHSRTFVLGRERRAVGAVGLVSLRGVVPGGSIYGARRPLIGWRRRRARLNHGYVTRWKACVNFLGFRGHGFQHESKTCCRRRRCNESKSL